MIDEQPKHGEDNQHRLGSRIDSRPYHHRGRFVSFQCSIIMLGAARPSPICDRFLKASGQALPVDDQRAAGRGVLFFPVHQQVQTGVIDVGQLVKVDVQVEALRNGVQKRGQFREAQERRRSLEVQVDATAGGVTLVSNRQVAEGVEQFRDRKAESQQHAGEHAPKDRGCGRHRVDRNLAAVLVPKFSQSFHVDQFEDSDH